MYQPRPVSDRLCGEAMGQRQMNGDTTELGIGGRCLEARDHVSLGLAAAGGSEQMAGMAFGRRKVCGALARIAGLVTRFAWCQQSRCRSTYRHGFWAAGAPVRAGAHSIPWFDFNGYGPSASSCIFVAAAQSGRGDRDYGTHHVLGSWICCAPWQPSHVTLDAATTRVVH